MDEFIIDEVHRDVFRNPKSTIDLDYLYSVKRQIQGLADDTNSQLKKNVYQNYSLFIESSHEISTLREEMKQLNTLLEQQLALMNKLLDQLNKTPIIQPNPDRSKIYPYSIPNGDVPETEEGTFPDWYSNAPEEFDVCIAQRKLKDAVRLVQKIRDHAEQYPSVATNTDLKTKIDNRIQELVNAICSELQSGPRSSINSIKLLRELNLSSRAVQLYLDQRSSSLRFVPTTTIQQLCTTFFHSIVETCSEFLQAFEVDKGDGDGLLFNSVRPIYLTARSRNDNQLNAGANFHPLSTYACLTNWIVQEFEYFIKIFKKQVFNSTQLSTSMIAESVYYLRGQCSRVANYCEIDMSEFIERELSDSVDQLVDDNEKKLTAAIKKLNDEEQWQPQQFQNKAQLTRFLEEMHDVDLKTMQKYIYEDLKLKFTSCKTSFARYFLITVNDLAKLITPLNKSRIDSVLANAFEMEMEHVVDSLKKVKHGSKPTPSRVRFIMGNNNFLLDKVIVVAQEKYTQITKLECNELRNLSNKYHAKVKSIADGRQ